MSPEPSLTTSRGELALPLAKLAHDLRQPLRSILLSVQRIQRQDSGISPETGSRLEDIISATRRQDEILTSIVEYDAAAQEGLSNDQWIGLPLAIQTACLKIELYRKQVNGSIRLPASPSRATAPSGFPKVLEKVLHNALKFHPKGASPEVEIDVIEDEPDWTTVRVADNGVGIEIEYRESIFEPFFRLHPASEYPGSGMGLCIAVRLMGSIGGSIRVVEPAGPRGSSIAIRFPVAARA